MKLTALQKLSLVDSRKRDFDQEADIDEDDVESHDELFLFIQSILDATVVLKQFTLNFPRGFSDEDFKWTLPSTLTYLNVSPSRDMLSSLLTTDQPCLHALKELTVFDGYTHRLYFNAPRRVAKKLAFCMPNLQKLTLHCETAQCEIITRVWCHRAFKSVVDLKLILFYETDIENMDYGEIYDVLNHIFREMTQLKSLDMTFQDLICADEYEWDSILLGSTMEYVADLRKDPSLWPDFIKEDSESEQDQVNGGEQEKRCVDIRNLKELRSLKLSGSFENENNVQVISDLSFRLGFSQLPKLAHLTLGKGFAREMSDIAKEWKEQSPGRTCKINSVSI